MKPLHFIESHQDDIQTQILLPIDVSLEKICLSQLIGFLIVES